MAKKDWETDGTREGHKVFCPVFAYGDCPYCCENGLCHINDPVEECTDFGDFYASWEEYFDDDSDDEYEPDVDETGFNPYEGAYDYDC